MKLSRHVRHSKRRKHTKRTKYMRHTKHRGKKYKNKLTYRKHPHKLKHKRRLQKGGYTDIDIVDEDIVDENIAKILTKQIPISYTKSKRSGLLGFFKDTSRIFTEPFKVTVKLTKISHIPDTLIEQQQPVHSREFTFEITLTRLNTDKNLKFITTLTKKYSSGSTYQTFTAFKQSIATPLLGGLTLTSTDNTETYTFTDFNNILWNMNTPLSLDFYADTLEKGTTTYSNIAEKIHDESGIARKLEVEKLRSEGKLITTEQQQEWANEFTKASDEAAANKAERTRIDRLYPTLSDFSDRSISSSSSPGSSNSANGAADYYEKYGN